MNSTSLALLLGSATLLQSATAATLEIPEMNVHLENVITETASESPINFAEVSANKKIEILGKGAIDQKTGEILSLVCITRSGDGKCNEVQAASYVRRHVFLFGSKYRFEDVKRFMPAAFFDQKGWNWASKPAKLKASQFYRIKARLAKRELKDLEKGYDGRTGFYSLGARGCFKDLQVDRKAIQKSLFLYDVQVQVAELFAGEYDCKGMTGLTLQSKVGFGETVTPAQRRRLDRAEKKGMGIQWGAYPYAWFAQVEVLDAAGKQIFVKSERSDLWWRQKRASANGASQAHALLFSFIDEGKPQQ